MLLIIIFILLLWPLRRPRERSEALVAARRGGRGRAEGPINIVMIVSISVMIIEVFICIINIIHINININIDNNVIITMIDAIVTCASARPRGTSSRPKAPRRGRGFELSRGADNNDNKNTHINSTNSYYYYYYYYYK